MKFSDLDKNLLTEAEAFDKKQGKINRMGTKLKSKLGPTKGMRQRATGKAQIQKQALDIKSEYMEWVGANDVDITASTLKQFLASSNYEHLADKVDGVAVKLKFKEPEVEKPKVQPADAEKAEEVSGDEEQEDMVSPEEMTGEKSSDDEIKAGYDKIAADAEAEAKELGAEDDEVEEEVDMSASIYESRLAYLLIEDKKLKDNQLDTLLVRVLQAAGAGGKTSSTDDSEQEKKEPKAKPESKPEKGESKYRKFMNKANKVAFGDLVGGDDDGDSSFDSEEVTGQWSSKVKEYNEKLEELLSKDKKLLSKFNDLKKEYWD